MEGLKAALADRYTLERELGRGGMATVYLARDLRHDRPVALKVLRSELGAILGPARFLQEIRFAAKLQHPHILPVFDSGEMAGHLWYAMPYVPGEALRARLRRKVQLPLEEAVRITLETADALAYAHRLGVVHRDIKPENILLEEGHAVVSDFGIAVAIEGAGTDRLTGSGLALGTPTYMSPEQAAGERTLDGRSDIYALGCVLYEMLAGEPPFTGPSPQAVLARRMAEPPPSLGIVRDVPGGVEQVVTRALARAPADRFQTAGEFADALAASSPAVGSLERPATSAGRLHRSRRLVALILAAVVTIGGGLLVLRFAREARAPSGRAPERTAVAVLPFQNLSADRAHAYFAAGLHGELLTQLSSVAALTVISRTSVMGYAGRDTPLRQIATELGVRSVVEGSVQVVNGRLRVSVDLVDAASDTQLWAERYDRALDDAFAIQSEVAQRIAAAVGAALGGPERKALADIPTSDPEAYRLYLQGREYLARPGYLRLNWESAEQLFDRALALDPGFAPAHAAVSEVHGRMYWTRHDTSPARLARQQGEAETALRLAPDSPDAHFAMGLSYYWGRRDYRHALQQFRAALQGRPGDARTWHFIGAVNRRLGNWDEVAAAFEQARRLNPRDPDLLYDGGYSFLAMHRYRDAIRAYDQAFELAPDLYGAALQKGWTFALWQGQLDTLRAVLSRVPDEAALGPKGTRARHQAQLLYWARQPDSLLRALELTRLDRFEGQDLYLPTSLYGAWAHQMRGDSLAARAAFDSARALLDSVLQQLPNDWRVHAARGLALAGLGRHGEARHEAHWLQRSIVYREDAMQGPQVAEDRARILAQTGDAGAALNEIERLLVRPSWLSGQALRLDPLWDKIRDDSRFRELLTKYPER